MGQYWSLNESAEGLLDLTLNLSELPAEDVAAQLWALHEMVIRRCESDRGLARIGSSEESDLAGESDRIGSNRIDESDRIGSDEVYVTCSEIAHAVGVETAEVVKRIFYWRGRTRDPLSAWPVLEYPVSALPDDWRLKVSEYASIGD